MDFARATTHSPGYASTTKDDQKKESNKMFLLDFLYLSWKCEILLFSDEFSAKGR